MVFVVRVVQAAAVALNFVRVAWKVVAAGVVYILDRDPENHHALVGSADAAEEKKSSFVVQNLQIVTIVTHGQMAAVLDSEDTVLPGIEFDSMPIGSNCLLIHSTMRQACHDSVAMTFAEVFENDYFENCCSALILRGLEVEQEIDHMELELASFQTKHALGDDILRSFGFVGADGYDSEPPCENSFLFLLVHKEFVFADETPNLHFEC